MKPEPPVSSTRGPPHRASIIQRIKFSILLPTRNRLEYLKLAVESVLRQDVRRLAAGDLRQPLRAGRRGLRGVAGRCAHRLPAHRARVPVTENWNRALALSDGDYAIMLGDDDALLDGYLSRMQELIAALRCARRDLHQSAAVHLSGRRPGTPVGVADGPRLRRVLRGRVTSRSCSTTRARWSSCARRWRFRLRYDFNAQFALISRRLIDSLARFGDFYQSDFPDYYSMNAAFLSARADRRRPGAARGDRRHAEVLRLLPCQRQGGRGPRLPRRRRGVDRRRARTSTSAG